MAINLDDYAPFDSGAGSNVMAEDWRKFIPHVRETGVIGQSREPGSTTEFEVFGDSTGMQVKVRAGECFINGHWGESTSEKILPIEWGHASLTRYDRIVLRADYVTENVMIVRKTGVAGSPSPQEVENTATYGETPLATVRVPAGAVTITAADVTDERYRVGSGMFSSWTPPLLAAGTTGLDTLPIGMGTGSSSVCRYRRDGKVLYVRWFFQWGTAPYNGQSGLVYTKLPPGFVARGPHHRIDAHLWSTNGGSFDWPGTALIQDGAEIVWPFFPISTTNPRISFYQIVSNVNYPTRVPDVAWPEGGQLTISGVIEVQ